MTDKLDITDRPNKADKPADSAHAASSLATAKTQRAGMWALSRAALPASAEEVRAGDLPPAAMFR